MKKASKAAEEIVVQNEIDKIARTIVSLATSMVYALPARAMELVPHNRPLSEQGLDREEILRITHDAARQHGFKDSDKLEFDEGEEMILAATPTAIAASIFYFFHPTSKPVIKKAA